MGHIFLTGTQDIGGKPGVQSMLFVKGSIIVNQDNRGMPESMQKIKNQIIKKAAGIYRQLIQRRWWDSNPRAQLRTKRFRVVSRYGRFDTSPDILSAAVTGSTYIL